MNLKKDIYSKLLILVIFIQLKFKNYIKIIKGGSILVANNIANDSIRISKSLSQIAIPFSGSSMFPYVTFFPPEIFEIIMGKEKYLTQSSDYYDFGLTLLHIGIGENEGQ